MIIPKNIWQGRFTKTLKKNIKIIDETSQLKISTIISDHELLSYLSQLFLVRQENPTPFDDDHLEAE